MKKFIFKLLLLAPLGLAVVALNWYVDPAHMFGAARGESFETERNMAQALLSGQNVTDFGRFDDRVLQKFLIADFKQAKDVIVLGSSRSMPINGSLFPGQNFFNHSCTGTALADYIALLDFYRIKGMFPKTIVLGLDPWILNKNNKMVSWHNIEGNYYAMKEAALGTHEIHFRIRDWIAPKYFELFSLSYFRSAWGQWRTGIHLAGPQAVPITFRPTQSRINQTQTLCADGSRVTGKDMRGSSIEEVRRQAVVFASGRESYGLDSFFELDDSLKNQLEAIVAYLQKQGVEVVFFLPPYHPEAYRIYMRSPQYRIIADVERYLRALAQKKNVKVLGSYNPARVHAAESEFLDGMHFFDSLVRNIFSSQNGL